MIIFLFALVLLTAIAVFVGGAVWGMCLFADDEILRGLVIVVGTILVTSGLVTALYYISQQIKL